MKLEDLKTHMDEHGFVLTDHCDSTLFSGLIGSTGVRVNITAAEKSPGEWLRRPTTYPECWGCGKSRSTISRDMLLGVYWYAWAAGDLPLLERMWRYGVTHFWRMGRGRWFGADTLMNTAMISTLAQMIYQLGGKNHWIARRLPTWWSVTADPDKYYVNRLTALHLMLRKRVWGRLGAQANHVTQALYHKWPTNAMFCAAAGKYGLARFELQENRPQGIHSQEEYPIEAEFTKWYLTPPADYSIL